MPTQSLFSEYRYKKPQLVKRAVDRIKRLSYKVLEEHQSKFGEDFADNKKILDQISIIRSKGLKNEMAGYITKYIKKQIREEKIRQEQNLSHENTLQDTEVGMDIEDVQDDPAESAEIVSDATEEDVE